MHVVERFTLVDGGRTLEAHISVDDLETYYQAWEGILRYRKDLGPFLEQVCAENNQQFDYHMPMAARPDF